MNNFYNTSLPAGDRVGEQQGL